MQSTDFQINITPKISALNSNVVFEFIFNNDYDISPIKAIKAKVHSYTNLQQLILDIVYLNKEIPLATKQVEVNKDNHITYLLDNLSLDQIDDNSIFNISSLNFELIDSEGKGIIDKVLIVQIIKNKGEIQKNII